MTNKFAPTYRSLKSSNYFFGPYMTNGRQRVKPKISFLRPPLAKIQRFHEVTNYGQLSMSPT